MGLYLTLHIFTGENPITLLPFSANLKRTFDNCGVCKGEDVRVIVFSQSEGDMEGYEAYTPNGGNANGHGYRGTWPVIINGLIQCF